MNDSDMDIFLGQIPYHLSRAIRGIVVYKYRFPSHILERGINPAYKFLNVVPFIERGDYHR